MVLRFISEKLNQKQFEKQLVLDLSFQKGEYQKYKSEVLNSNLIKELNDKKRYFESTIKGKTYRNNAYSMGPISITAGINIYAVLRKIKPRILVETGVANGFSTSFILLALFHNNCGHLYSIDFPEIANKKYEKNIFWEGKGGAVIPPEKESGWVIPDYLRNNWELIIGKSQEKLLPLLQKLKTIDFFFHDGEHSPQNMSFEFNESYKILNSGGILLSDELTKTFIDFTKKHNKKITRVGTTTGFFIK